MAVTMGLATAWPILPVKTVDPLPTKSASSPCPHASWKSTPPNSLPMMTAIWPGGRRRGVEKGNGPFRRGPGILGGRGVVEELEAALHARSLHRRLNLAVALGDGVHHQPDAGAGVGVMNPFGGGDEHLLRALAVTDRNLLDRTAHGAGRLVRFQQQLALCLRANRVGRHRDPLRRPRRPAQLSECKSSAAAAPDLRRQVGSLE